MLESRMDNFQITASNYMSHNKKKFADIVAKSLKSPSAQFSMLRANEYALKVDERKNSSPILKNCVTNRKKLKTCSELSGNFRLEAPVSVFRFRQQKGSPLLKVVYKAAENAQQMLR